MPIQLSGSLAITGSLVATSQIVAQTLNVQQVTSSIVYSSGSNIFGNSVSNTQQFTGSLQVSGSTSYILGNVGIGTTSPFGTTANRTVLSVNGTTDVSLNIGSGGSQRAYLYGSSTYADLGTIGSLPLTFSPNNTERVRITSGGNVGIGTTSPSSILEVSKMGAQTASIFINQADANEATIRFKSTHGSDSDYRVGASILVNSAFEIYSVAAASTRFIVTNSGSVGIGTTTPNERLQVAGAISATGTATTSFASSATMDWFSTGARFISRGANTSTTGTFTFLVESSNSSIATNAMVISNSANVGIGTTSPGSRLQIQVDSDFTGGVNYTTPHLFIRSGASAASGNVTRLALGIFDGAQVYLDAICTSTGGGAADLAIATRNVGAPTEKVRITAAGNVGIGITSPTQLLDVRSANTSGATGATIRIGSQNHGGSGDEFANLEFFWGDPDYAEVKAKIYAKNTGNVGPGGGGAADLLFATRPAFGSLTEHMRITSSGNTIINPVGGNGVYSQSLLTIKASVADGNQIHMVQFNDDRGWRLKARNDGHFYLQSTHLGSDNTRLMVQYDTGYVGVGTTSPSNGMSTSGVSIGNFNSNYGFIELSSNDTEGYGSWIDFSQSTGADYRGRIRYWSVDNKFYFYTNGSSTPLVTFGPSNVGIGTTSPTQKLNIFGTAGSGTVTPQETLVHIGGNELGNSGGYAGMRLGGAGNATSYGVYIRGVKQGNYGNYWDTALTFNVTRTSTETTVDEAMRITSDSHVLIGSTSTFHNSKLSVAGPLFFQYTANTDIGGRIYGYNDNTSFTYEGGLKFQSFKYNGSSYTMADVMTINGQGNVGIGTTSPSTKLHVVGSQTLTNSTGIFIEDFYSSGGYTRVGSKYQTTNNCRAEIRFINPSTGADSDISLAVSDAGNNLYNAMYIKGVGGIITTPFQPAFRAGRSTSYSPGGASTIVFNSTSGFGFNIGGHYNTSNGRFTAPVNGVYNLTACVIWESVPDGQQMDDAFEIRVNGNTAAYSFRRAEYVAGTTGNGGYYVDNATVLLNLTAGQYVEIYNRFNLTIHGNANYCYFSGYLVG